MLENYLMPQLQQDMDRDFTFQSNGAPTHFHGDITSYLIRTVVALNWRAGTKAWPSR